jgi:hypothetical protein
MAGNVLTLHDDPQEGEPLLIPVLRGGKRVNLSEPLSGTVHLIGGGEHKGVIMRGYADGYSAAVTPLISAQVWNAWILAARCSTAVT